MNVGPGQQNATAMLLALTQLDHTTVHVSMDMLVTERIARVRSLKFNIYVQARTYV